MMSAAERYYLRTIGCDLIMIDAPTCFSLESAGALRTAEEFCEIALTKQFQALPP
jgi:hypothetical protein